MTKTIITATDKIGRTETIKLELKENVKRNLIKDHTYINEMYDDYVYGTKSILTKSQFYKLKNFLHLIYNKFYNYTLTIK